MVEHLGPSLYKLLEQGQDEVSVFSAITVWSSCQCSVLHMPVDVSSPQFSHSYSDFAEGKVFRCVL